MPISTSSYIVFVGAVYIDTILSVPHFPAEDEKLRAHKQTRRRGGNCANSLQVLEQLIEWDPFRPKDNEGRRAAIEGTFGRLHLLAVLPDFKSQDVKFIRESLPGTSFVPCSIFRSNMQHAASSYIIQNESKGTRTIVSYNGLPEMTFKEFDEQISRFNALSLDLVTKTWYHFEGRNSDTLLQCVKHIRNNDTHCQFSVELEKPDRVGLIEVASLADVVFYSKLWAEGHGFEGPRPFLEAQVGNVRSGALLICTWGAEGATALQTGMTKGAGELWESSEAWQPPSSQEGDISSNQDSVIDPVGAGDSFIAGILFCILHRQTWSLRRKIAFASELAGRKVFQNGFDNLGEQIFSILKKK
ncbi:Ribokinase-like protein [Aaosphaeria arxii CBS 175.79]|uniref:Ribokinase-like protein n=1 Tax=Aaosphaeria arxii CBS 175.79 TaxID=1450172 RepID=A0A6A5XD38_9PLEO|nr:Ribokinase-like protein [Aaosphaeria arxii CBS 175.79]KAF2010717.1 Ribokinase-like protein [Aaosphaeria arxii CBS 175.79]